MHVIDRNERFTLVGSDARRGKLTLFPGDGPRDPGVLHRIGLRVHDVDAAVHALPAGIDVERSGASAHFVAPGALGLTLVERHADGVEYDIDHVTFVVRDPDRVHRELSGLGFSVACGLPDRRGLGDQPRGRRSR